MLAIASCKLMPKKTKKNNGTSLISFILSIIEEWLKEKVKNTINKTKSILNKENT